MSNASELDNFLETPEVEEAAVTPEAPASAEATTEAKTTEGKGDNDAGTPPAGTDESTAKTGAKPHWSESAYHDEKRKRQELERRLAEIEKPAKQEEVDLFVDPKGFTQGLKNELKNELLTERINLSREIMAETKSDYADKEARFVQMAQADPSLVAKMNASPNPAKFAYETAAKAIADEAKLKLLDEIGDPAAYREKLKQELLAELGGKPPAKTPLKAIVDRAPSLATASAAKANTDVPDDSLEALFPAR